MSLAQSPPLRDLQAMLEREIPMCGQMGICVHTHGPEGLVMRLPLDQNRNHQQTAFAGSLNAVCTIAGWGTVFLLMKEFFHEGVSEKEDCHSNIVIRRSSIRYHEPVESPDIFARCLPVAETDREYFLEMLREKAQAKLDLTVEIAGLQRPAVLFTGSYVVMRNMASDCSL